MAAPVPPSSAPPNRGPQGHCTDRLATSAGRATTTRQPLDRHQRGGPPLLFFFFSSQPKLQEEAGVPVTSWGTPSTQLHLSPLQVVAEAQRRGGEVKKTPTPQQPHPLPREEKAARPRGGS